MQHYQKKISVGILVEISFLIIIRRKFTIQIRKERKKKQQRGVICRNCVACYDSLSTVTPSKNLSCVSLEHNTRMLQPSPDLHLTLFGLTGVKAAMFLLPKPSPQDCIKWLHKKLFHMPAAKLCFCPGYHHIICQCSARHLLLGLMPNPQDSVWNQSCERCNYETITILFSGS